jgi:phytoene dehydrogenase-like protein
MAESYDVVVVGGGHNGLACAGYLAKAGKRVLVLEARSVAGGGCATEEVAAPGFRHNFHSNFHGIIHMGPVYGDLELERYGASYVWPENQFAHVFPDGRAIVCSRGVERTAASIARFSRADAETFRELAHAYRKVLEQAFIPAMFSPPAPPSGELAPLEETTEGLTLLRHFLSSPNHVARDLFESPEVRT